MYNSEPAGKELLKRSLPVYLILALLIVAVVIFSKKKLSGPPVDKAIEQAMLQGIYKDLLELVQNRKTWDMVFEEYIGEPAPGLSASDIYGNKVDLAELTGRQVVIVMFNSQNPQTPYAFGLMNKIRGDYPADALEILAVSVEGRTAVSQFLQSQTANFTVIAKNGQYLPLPYDSVITEPTFIFIDEKGRFKMGAVGGAISEAELKALIDVRFGKKLFNDETLKL